jgi:hypothetical protein
MQRTNLIWIKFHRLDVSFLNESLDQSCFGMVFVAKVGDHSEQQERLKGVSNHPKNYYPTLDSIPETSLLASFCKNERKYPSSIVTSMQINTAEGGTSSFDCLLLHAL